MAELAATAPPAVTWSAADTEATVNSNVGAKASDTSEMATEAVDTS